MKKPQASDSVTATQAADLINSLIETGAFSEYAQICLIRAMGALGPEIKAEEVTEEEMADARKEFGGD